MAVTLPDGLRPVQIEEFGGLQLSADPEELGFRGAVDAYNVEFEPGRVRARWGTQLFSTPGAAWATLALGRYKKFDGDPETLIVITRQFTTSNVYAIRDDGTAIDSDLQNAAIGSMQAVGTPTASYVYVPTGTANLLRFDGTAWSTVAFAPGATNGPVGLSPTDNRLVVGNVGSNPHRVQFSDPGAPETFTTNNYVDLTPGDGESIRAMAVWGNQLFAFKKSKYFVFYGNSSHFAADGTEVDDFNYRTFANGVGALNERCAVPGPDGVYFFDRTGIYRTTGGPAVKVSGALDPYFSEFGNVFFYGRATFDPAFGKTNAALGWSKGRLFASAHAGPDIITLLWDPKLDAWTSWSTKYTAFTEMTRSNLPDAETSQMFGSSDGKVYFAEQSLTSDNGAAFTTRYRSGFSDFGNPAREKTIRETELIGTGTPSLAWSREYGSPGSAQSVSLGSSRRGLDRSAHVGELLSYQLSGPAAWSVQRLVPQLREARGVGEETS